MNDEKRQDEQEASSLETSVARLRALSLQSERLCCLVAQNIATPSPLLEEISKRAPSTAVLSSLLKNPNTPLAILLHWAQGSPKLFLENPALDLLLLEHPELFSRLSESALRVMCELPSAPAVVLVAASAFPSCHNALAQHRRLPVECIPALSLSRNLEVRRRIAQHPKTPPEQLRLLAQDEHWLVRQEAALHANTPPETLALLRRCGGSYNLSRVEITGALSDSDAAALAAGGPWAHQLLLWNPKAPPGLLIDLFVSAPLNAQREAIRMNPALPEEALSSLWQEGLDERLASELEQNDLSEYALPQHSRDTYVLLARQRIEGTKAEIASHSRLSLSFIKKFLSPALQQFLPKNPNLSSEAFRWLLDAGDWKSKRDLANNIGTPAEILPLLAKDNKKEVRIAVAARPNLPLSVLEILCDDKFASVVKILLERRDLPTKLQQKLTGRR
jgi:hypothetical protein